ncbi:MAG: LysM domain-containing protein [Solirubrobacterales bacterium]
MKKRNSIIARILAALALIAVIVAVVMIVSHSLKEDSSSSKKTGANHHAKKHKPKQQKTKAKTYEVQSGDTLTAIAAKTGLTVAELQALNPEVDAQNLTVGEVLKLRE